MKSTIRFKPLLGAGLLCALLTACPGPTHQQQATQVPATTLPSDAAARETMQPQPAAQVTALKDGSPSILITGRTLKALQSDIITWRTRDKGMKLRSKSNTQLIFSLPVARSNPPREARVSYRLQRESGGIRLSARVYQFMYPGTSSEAGEDLTVKMYDALSKELPRYLKTNDS